MSACGPQLCDTDLQCPPGQYCNALRKTCLPLTGVCRPKQQRSCYTGTKRTSGVGLCREGRQTCLPSQRWGPCEGQTLPTTEFCNGKDDNCDGLTDNQCQVSSVCQQTSLSSLLEVSTLSRPGAPHRLEVTIALKSTAKTFQWLSEKPALTISPVTWKVTSFVLVEAASGDAWKIVLEKTGLWDKAVTLTLEGRLRSTSSDGWLCPVTISSPARSLVCQGQEQNCGGQCLSLENNPQHCGACDNACKAGERCCGQGCVDVSSSPQHCGSCNNSCSASARCLQGVCVECRTNSDCNKGEFCRQRRCLRCPGDKSCDRALFWEGSQQVQLHKAVVDSKGDWILTGLFAGSLTLFGKTFKDTRNGDIFLARISGDWQSLRWWRMVSSPGPDAQAVLGAGDELLQLLLLPGDDVLLGGQYGAGGQNYAGTVFEGQGADAIKLPVAPRSGNGIFLTQVTSAGKPRWARAIGGNWIFQGMMALASNGKEHWAVMWMDAGLDSFTCAGKKLDKKPADPTTARRQVLVKLSSKGDCVQGHAITPLDFLVGIVASLAVDSKGNVYWLGRMSSRGSLGNNKPSTTSTGGNPHTFLAKFSPDGTLQWVRFLGVFEQMLGHRLVLDAKDQLFLSGQFKGRVTLGQDTLQASGKWDVFVSRLKADGSFLWSRRAGGVEIDRPISMSIHRQGTLCVLSSFSSEWKVGKLLLVGQGEQDLAVTCWKPDGTLYNAEVFGGMRKEEGADLFWHKDSLVVTGWTKSSSVSTGGVVWKKQRSSSYQVGFVWQWKP